MLVPQVGIVHNVAWIEPKYDNVFNTHVRLVCVLANFVQVCCCALFLFSTMSPMICRQENMMVPYTGNTPSHAILENGTL